MALCEPDFKQRSESETIWLRWHTGIRRLTVGRRHLHHTGGKQGGGLI